MVGKIATGLWVRTKPVESTRVEGGERRAGGVLQITPLGTHIKSVIIKSPVAVHIDSPRYAGLLIHQGASPDLVNNQIAPCRRKPSDARRAAL